MDTRNRAGLWSRAGACAVLLAAGAPPVQADLCATATILHSFTPAERHPGRYLMRGGDGSFYGIYAGTKGAGGIFRITPGGQFSDFYSFAGADGGGPYFPPIEASDSNFYGTTESGGSTGSGTVYRITPAGVLTTLHTFAALSDPHTLLNADGYRPIAGLLQGTDGSFYGTTLQGGPNAGPTSSGGTIFRIGADGSFTMLHVFSEDATAGPVLPLVQGPDGNIYGTMENGPVFRITPAGVYAELHAAPSGAVEGFVLGPDGRYYGSTPQGGKNRTGSVFAVAMDGNEATVHEFGIASPTGTSINYGGQELLAGPIVGQDGQLYGTTYQGGLDGWGVFYRLSTAGKFMPLYNFAGTGALGKNPKGLASPSGVVEGLDGNFYGVTELGGTYDWGVFYRLTLKHALVAGVCP